MTKDQWQAELEEAAALYESQRIRLGVPAGPRFMEARERMLAAQAALRKLEAEGGE